MKKCGRCSKPAVLHITELRQGDVKALHLCEVCAKEYLSQSPAEQVEPTPDDVTSESADDLDGIDQQSCPSCGITFKDFRAGGRLGCPQDYTVFEDELLPLLENIHGETDHSQRQVKLIKLRSDLRVAVEEERYEVAAKIRDEIQSISSENSSHETA